MKVLQIVVSENFDLPDIYKSDKSKEIEECLIIGSLVHQEIRKEFTNDAIKDIENNKAKEIAAIKSKADATQKVLQEEIFALQTEITKQNEKYQSELRDIKKKTSSEKDYEYSQQMAELKEKIIALETRRALIENSRDEDINKAILREQNNLERLLSEKEKDILRITGLVDRLQDTISRQSDEISKMSTSFAKRTLDSKLSTQKGSGYEDEFKSKLYKYYGVLPGFELKTTARGAGHEGDHIMMIENKGIMWELKNYSEKVPTIEVKKFQRDMKGMDGVRIGVMISRKTDIVGTTGPFTIEEWDGKMLIYINRIEELCSNTDDENYIFQILLGLFRMWWKYGLVEKDCDSAIETEKILHEVEKGIEDLSKKRTEWKTHKGRLDDLSRWVSGLLDDTFSRLNGILNRVKGVDEDEIVESIQQLPAIFAVGCKEKYGKIVGGILAICEIGEFDNEIAVAELCDSVAKKLGQSKETINKNLTSIFIDSAFIKRRNVRYIKGVRLRESHQ